MTAGAALPRAERRHRALRKSRGRITDRDGTHREAKRRIADSGRLIVAIALLMTANRSAISGRRSRGRSRHHRPLGTAVDRAHQRMFSVMMPARSAAQLRPLTFVGAGSVNSADTPAVASQHRSLVSAACPADRWGNVVVEADSVAWVLPARHGDEPLILFRPPR